MSPTRNLPSWANTAGSPFKPTTCPAITELPSSPGRAPYLYQPTLAELLGIAMSPLGVLPTYSTAASTLIAEIFSRTGNPAYDSFVAGATLGTGVTVWGGSIAGVLK